MATLSALVPEFARELADAVTAEGRPELAASILLAEVDRWTLDSQAGAAYIYLARAKPSAHAETIPVVGPHLFNVDVDRDSQPEGVELLGGKDIIARLRSHSRPRRRKSP